MSCTYTDFGNEAKTTVAAPWQGVGLPNAYAPQFINAFNTGYNVWLNAMWTGYSSGGCGFWTNRVNHWTNQIANNNYNPYVLGRKQAKILFAQNMHTICNCSGPTPRIANPGAYVTTKIIRKFDLDLSPIKADSSVRTFALTGDNGAIFNLEIKNEDGYYYNFVTSSFAAAQSGLYNEVITGETFSGEIKFPTVTDNDQYDIYLTADPLTTKHAAYAEARFKDGTLDINRSIGSNSLLLTKVIYQYIDQTLTISTYSSSGTIEVGSSVSSTINLPSGSTAVKQPFSIACSVSTAAKCYQVIKQPVGGDFLSFVSPVVGAAPITIEGENIYPTATAAFVGDDVNGAITSGAVVEIDANVAGNVVIDDKITTPVTTDTVNGDFTGESKGRAITMDSAIATKMAVGDQVTGNAELDAGVFTVTALTSTNVFQLSAVAGIEDGTTLTFSSKINRSLTTVLSLDPSAQAKQFTMSQDIQFRDNAPLTFFNQKNYQWPVNNFVHLLRQNMVVVPSTSVTAGSFIDKYEETVTEFPGTINEKIIIKKEVAATSTLAIKPIVTRGEITTQAGSVVFNKQQVVALAGETLKLGGYGEEEILRVYGYDIIFSDLALVLTPVTTTTTAASAGGSSASVVVASRNGILDDVSVVSGIGINPILANPLVDSGAGAVTGAGTIVLDAVQSLENGVTLTFANAGQTATITGTIQVLKVGSSDQTLRLDVDRLLSIT